MKKLLGSLATVAAPLPLGCGAGTPTSLLDEAPRNGAEPEVRDPSAGIEPAGNDD